MTAVRSCPPATRSAKPAWIASLGPAVAAGEHADEGGVGHHQLDGGQARPLPAGEPDRQEAPVAGRPRRLRLLGERPTDRVVDQVDTTAPGQLAQCRGDGSVPVVDRGLGPERPAQFRPLVVAHHGDDPGPRARPSCTAAAPLPPAPPSTANQSPGAIRPRPTSPIHPVICGIQKPAASMSSRPGGTRRSWIPPAPGTRPQTNRSPRRRSSHP